VLAPSVKTAYKKKFGKVMVEFLPLAKMLEDGGKG
jgi:hypothetical protein